jgi:hypothetical protein
MLNFCGTRPIAGHSCRIGVTFHKALIGKIEEVSHPIRGDQPFRMFVIDLSFSLW